ncbi:MULTISPECIES: type II secretion system F family protein [Streptomyces]|uniref:type II secretion system F family protein n=1 Tax=Streptomyces TaxID=1883 RepID=UPI0006911829|nr:MULTISPECIES: type II secretion system F family protein [Streptomyces]
MLLGRELFPARPGLGEVLDRLDSDAPRSSGPLQTARGGRAGLQAVLDDLGGKALTRYAGLFSVPEADLELLGISPARHAGTKIGGVLGGLLLPQLYPLLSLVMGDPAAWDVPLVLSLVLAFALWHNADLHVRQQARRVRVMWRHAIASFLERALLERGAGAGAEALVQRTAAVGDGPMADRIRSALEHAQLNATPPWQALADLGERLRIPELAAPADSFALAGDGANVRDVLTAQARMLRQRLFQEQRSQANAASAKAVLPGTVFFTVAFVLFIAPSISAMTIQ